MDCTFHKENLCQLIVNSESICTVVVSCGVFCFFVILCCWGLNQGPHMQTLPLSSASPVWWLVCSSLLSSVMTSNKVTSRLLCTGSALPLLFSRSFLVLLLPWIVIWGSHTQFSIKIICIHLSLYVHVPVEVVVGSHMWVLRTKHRSFAKSVGALNYWAIFSALFSTTLNFSLFFFWDRVSPCSSSCLELTMKTRPALNYSQSSLNSCKAQSQCLIITKGLGFACSMSLYLISLALARVPWPSHKATSKQ